MTLLKQEALAKYNLINSSKNNTRVYESEINFEKINEILENSEQSQITYANMPNLLGSYYNETYFNNLKNIEELSIDIFNSNYFEDNADTEEKRAITEEVLVFAFDNNLVNLTEKVGSDPLQNCLDKAEADHERRLAFFAATGAAQAGAAIVTGGTTFISGGITWIGGSIYSGIQYDADVEYCNKQFKD